MTQEQKPRTMLERLIAWRAESKVLIAAGCFRKSYVTVINSAANTAVKEAQKRDE